MSVFLIAVLAWLIVGFVVAVAYGRSIRRADEQLRQRLWDVSR